MLTRGRIAHDWSISGARSLDRAELSLLKEKRIAPVIQRFRDPHHRLARFIATGMRPEEAAFRSGYSRSRVTHFAKDPAFQELVAHYRALVNKGFAESQDDYYELATANMLTAERMLAEKLEKADEENESLPTKDLLAISRDAADRFGYGKKQTNVNVNVDFAAQLDKAIKRSGKVIDFPASPSTLSPDAEPSGEEASPAASPLLSFRRL